MSQPTTRSAGSATASPQHPGPSCVPQDLDLDHLLALLSEPPPVELDWSELGLCAQTDPEAFFPEKGGSTREAKRICSGCEVRAECLEDALANDERFGIWGGLSERERRHLRRERQTEGTR